MDLFLEDSTLREGEQSPGVVFTTQEKIHIARLLQTIGVNAIEVGTPVMGGPEGEAIRALVDEGLNLRVIGWNRAKKSDIDKSLECGLDSLHIGLPTSEKHVVEKFQKTRGWVIETMQQLVSYAKSQNAWVSVSAEDAGRADVSFLLEYVQAAEAARVDRVRISDTIGVLNPFSTFELFSQLKRATGVPLQPHMHNDFGLATANTLAAISAGARHVHMTVNGLGERAGLAPLEEVIMAAQFHLDSLHHIHTERLSQLCDYVSMVSRRAISPNKPIVGEAIFEHESGIHVDGILRDPTSFEPFEPGSVGRQRSIVIGKHSGTRAIRYTLERLGLPIKEVNLPTLVSRVRYKAVELHRALDDHEFVTIYRELNQ